MPGEVVIDIFEGYIDTLKKLKIKKIAFTEINEKRPVQVKRDTLKVIPIKKLELLAYRHSIIYKCLLNDADFDHIYRILLDEGFQLTRISRNIT